jgi:DNA replication protein DnaC
MQPTNELLPSQFFAGTEVSGECGLHGPSNVQTFGAGKWYCATCLEATLADESRSVWESERNAHLKKVADIPAKYVGQVFTATTPAQKRARVQVKQFRDFILKERTWAVLVLFGGNGTGKTLMACEFAQALIANCGWQVRYITAKGMVAEIQASYRSETKSEEGEISKFVRYEVLILDEIDAKSGGQNSNVLLTEVINRRYNAGRPVIVITNQPFEKLAEFVGDRVHDRLHENSFIAAFDWASFRRAG